MTIFMYGPNDWHQYRQNIPKKPMLIVVHGGGYNGGHIEQCPII